jgi:tungstate transport system substrate-binding protein
VKTFIVGSGTALRLGRTGTVDLVWVHAPEAETAFVKQGYGIKRQPVMKNNFILVGPSEQANEIPVSLSILDAMRLIAQKHYLFVSRADDSGTNKKELWLWSKIHIDPYLKPWYLEAGEGMADSLKLAEERRAFILVDRATFLVNESNGFRVIVKNDDLLSNPYSVIAVNPAKHPSVNSKAAKIFIEWLNSSQTRQFIANYQFRDKRLFSVTEVNH